MSNQLRKRGDLPTRRRPSLDTSSTSPTGDALPQIPEQQFVASCELKFSHSPLDLSQAAIRFIDILPCGESNPNLIECNIILSASILEHTYEALSYEWGDSDASRKILINGMKFFVRDNLWSALYHLREESARRLWIDAICIDQDNVRERNHQVWHMSTIYSSASRVLVWLGQESDQSVAALRAVSSINIGLKRYKNLSMAHYDHTTWDSLRNMCNNSYWSRLWIVQEIGLAQGLRIHWGRNHIEWGEFANLYDILPRDLQESLAFQLIQQRKARHNVSCFLKDLLETCRESLCSNPRDKIYGLLGLADDCRDGSLKPDYSKSLFDLYEDVIRFQHESFSNGVSVVHEHDVWSIVSFSQQLQWILWHPISGADEDCTAELDLRSSPSYHDGDLLRIVGFWGGSVLSIGPECINGMSSEAQRDAWFTEIAQDFNSTPELDMNEGLNSLVRAFATFEATERHRIILFHGLALQGSVELNQLTDLTTLSTMYEPRTKKDIYAGEYSQTSPHLFATYNGDIGIAPREVERGDLVCRFLHCDVAVIVRSFEYGYRIIGRAVIAKPPRLGWAYDRKYGKLSYDTPQFPSMSDYPAHMTFFLDMATLQLLTR
jgi:hypothetical protein